MTGFSWSKLIEQADKNLLRQAKLIAKQGDSQERLEHQDEFRDANQGNYTKLTLRVKQELKIKRETLLERRERIAIGQR